ncbi:hydrolase [Haladaptatus sp. W1]|uniref:HAD family hydrolase n=1 Tax=Haladaptatus sp. W1 TaxID=1897478 RepID=UPI0008498D0A|nr:HAD family hydrolase [Haladaptatus sp. W1]ODR82264.1 hydrolase [Haladaptatus sp. W1]
MYDAVLFDNDGVLVRPPKRELLRDAAVSAFEEFDVDPAEDHLDAVTHSATPDGFRRVCEEYGFDPDAFWKARDSAASETQLQEIRAGRTTTYDDVGMLSDFDRPLGLVSSNQQATVEFMLDYFELGRHFETYYGRPPTIEGIRRKKPDPHFLELALSDLGVEDALFVGDSESDVVAAHNAGVDSAFIRRPHRADYDLTVEPTYEIEGLPEIFDVLDRGVED